MISWPKIIGAGLVWTFFVVIRNVYKNSLFRCPECSVKRKWVHQYRTDGTYISSMEKVCGCGYEWKRWWE
jgi:hypothetical protein